MSRKAYSAMNRSFLLAQDDADAWLVIRVAQQIVHRRKVEVHLASELRPELHHLEVDHDKASQPKVIEEKVEVEIIVTKSGVQNF